VGFVVWEREEPGGPSQAAGHRIVTADVDIHGAGRWLAAARVFAPRRERDGP
jgi:hypothetical protein